MFRLTLALLLAGFAAVSATNSSSSSSDTAAASSSSSSAAGTTTTSTGGGNTTSSSSSATTTTGGSSSSSAGTTTTGTTGSSSSSGTTTTGTTGSSSSGTTTTGTTGSSSAGTTTTGTTSGTTTGSSSAGTTTTGTTGQSGNVTKGADVEVVQIKATVGFKATIPDTATGASLQADATFTGPLKTELATAAGVAANLVNIIKITLSAGRVRQLSNTTAGSSKKLIKVDFTVTATTTITKAAVTTSLGNAMAGLNTKLVNANLKVGGAAVTVDTSYTPTSAVVELKSKKKTSGPFTVKYYTDNKCGAGEVAAIGTIGATGATACAKGSTATGSFKVAHCTTDGPGAGTDYNGKADCSTGGVAATFVDGACTVSGSKSYSVHCGLGAAASTSDASTKSLVGVVFGLVMGLVTLM